MSENDTEIWIGKTRVYLGKDNIVYASPVGDIDEKMAIALKENILEYANKVDGRVNSLVDLTKVGQPSIKAREIGKESLNHEKVGKLALYGLNPVARMLASFVIGIQKNKNIRFFKSKEEALAWLKE